jgi:hypothetical protein
MIKLHYQDDQENLLEACGGAMNALIETERGVKSAASDLIGRDVIEQFLPDKDHFLIHSTAMGDQETYGPNKNGDGWPKEALARKHQTFVTNGHFFREHRNRDPKQKIGDIKYAAFRSVADGGMGRVELLKWGHKKLAEEEYELAKAGKELCFSMSARVPEDVCSCCDHHAKRASDYCDHLKFHMLQYRPEFKKYAFASNPDPNFFDDSRVVRPADRIARYLEYRFSDDGDRQKAASQNAIITGAEWAAFEGVMIPDSFMPNGLEGQMLRKLAAAEAFLDTAVYGHDKRANFATAFAPFALSHDMDASDIAQWKRLRPGTLFRELAKSACIMSLPTFAAYVTDSTPEEIKASDMLRKVAAELLPVAFRTMEKEGCVAELLTTFAASGEFSASCDTLRDDVMRQTLKKSARLMSIEPGIVQDRLSRLVSAQAEGTWDNISEGEAAEFFHKAASYSDNKGMANTISKAYSHYQIAALADIERLKGAGYVDEQEATLVTGSNRRLIFR